MSTELESVTKNNLDVVRNRIVDLQNDAYENPIFREMLGHFHKMMQQDNTVFDLGVQTNYESEHFAKDDFEIFDSMFAQLKQ